MENMEKVVYLDNAATTPCAPEALEMMVKALSGACGNPSSHYSIGYEAKEFVDTGRAQVAKAINASPAELFFTSCGSEADNWAVKGTAFTKARQNKKHLITSAFVSTGHPSFYGGFQIFQSYFWFSCFQATYAVP